MSEVTLYVTPLPPSQRGFQEETNASLLWHERPILGRCIRLCSVMVGVPHHPLLPSLPTPMPALCGTAVSRAWRGCFRYLTRRNPPLSLRHCLS